MEEGRVPSRKKGTCKSPSPRQNGAVYLRSSKRDLDLEQNEKEDEELS